MALPVDKNPVALENDLARRDETVIATTTQKVGWAALFGQTTETPAPVTTAAPTTTAGGLGGIFGFLNNAAATTAAAATPATVAAVSTQAAAAAATPASSTGSGGFLLGLLGLFDSGSSTTAAATPAAATTAAASTSSSSSSGLLGWLSGIFGGSSSSANASPLAVASTATPVASAAAATSSSSGGLFANILGSGSSATGTVSQPAFTGQVTVDYGTNTASAQAAVGTASILSNSEIAQVARYAEMGKGITYSPYTKSGSCKTASEVALDIEMLSDYSIIRLYSVDCLGIENVIAAMSLSQKLFLGIWDITAYATDLPSMAQQVLTGSRGWLAVHTVSIGNEVVNAGTNTVAQVKSAVSLARLWFKTNASLYSGYIVAVDTLAAVMADSSMCDISDYLAVNCHPYFSAIEASTSGTWLQQQVSSLQSHCSNGKSILITETGWPTFGNTLGEAVPSQSDQLAAIKAIGQAMGDQVIMFTTYNDYWKLPGSYNVEQHWGIYGDPLV